MKVLLFGATGMVGQGVMRECLIDPSVEKVVTVGRHPTGDKHPKLGELVYPDLSTLAPLEPQLGGFDASYDFWPDRDMPATPINVRLSGRTDSPKASSARRVFAESRWPT